MQLRKLKNRYEVRGNVTAIFLKSKKYGLMEALINTTDLQKLQSLNTTLCAMWNKHTRSFYCMGRLKISTGKYTTIMLHRIVTECPKGMITDHINHDTLDCTRGNLRVVTNAENHQNRKGATTANKSGVQNVDWYKPTKKWRVQIKLNGKKIHIGYFKDIQDAESAAINARNKYMPYSIKRS